MFQRLLDEIKYLLRIVKAGSKEAKQLEKIKKLFEEAYRDAKNTAQHEDGVKYSLGHYSDEQKNNWAKSNKIIIYENKTQLEKFINNCIDNKDFSKKIYFGIITGNLAERIQSDTGLDFNGKNAVLRANNVRKILKDHGNSETESKRGQIAVTKDDFLFVPEIFGEPDIIKKEPQGYNGRPAATFEKTIGVKKYSMFVVDSGGSLDIFMQTMFIHKEKGSIANVANANALTGTSKTPVGTAPTNNVQQIGLNVNSKLSLSENTQSDQTDSKNTHSEDVAVKQDETSLPADVRQQITVRLKTVDGITQNAKKGAVKKQPNKRRRISKMGSSVRLCAV